MARFESYSRYVKYSHGYHSVDGDGRKVLAVAPAKAPEQPILGDHRVDEGERLDHLANFYLGEPTAFWRLAEANDCIVPDAVLARPAIDIPNKE